MWVRSEYAGELAVLLTWLSALLPWSVSGLRADLGQTTATVVNLRFVFVQFHYVFGLSLGDQPPGELVQLVHRIPAFVPANQRLEGQLWVLAAAVYLAVLLFSVLYYAREDLVVERSPVDPVRVLGGGLGVVAAVLAGSSILFYAHQFTVPLGTLFIAGFAAVLLRVDRT